MIKLVSLVRVFKDKNLQAQLNECLILAIVSKFSFS